MDSKTLGFIVAEVKVKKTIKFAKEDNQSTIKIGRTVTISSLDHPTDVKLWGPSYQWQISPEYFDIKNPTRIITPLKKGKGKTL